MLWHVSVFYSLLLPNNNQLYGCATFVIHLSADGHLADFHFLAVMDNTTVNICAQIFV